MKTIQRAFIFVIKSEILGNHRKLWSKIGDPGAQSEIFLSVVVGVQGLVRGAATAEAYDDVHAVEEAVQAQPRMSQSEYGQGARRVSEGCGFWVPHGYGGRQADILGRGLKEIIALYQKVAKLGDHAGQWNLRIFYLQVELSNRYLRA